MTQDTTTPESAAVTFEGYSSYHNNVPFVGAAGNWRCTKCGRESYSGLFGRCDAALSQAQPAPATPAEVREKVARIVYGAMQRVDDDPDGPWPSFEQNQKSMDQTQSANAQFWEAGRAADHIVTMLTQPNANPHG